MTLTTFFKGDIITGSILQLWRLRPPRDASAEMGLISPGGENLLDFLELGQVLQLKTVPQGPLWWPQERPVPKRVALEPLGIPLPSMPGPKTFLESGPDPEDASPVLT